LEIGLAYGGESIEVHCGSGCAGMTAKATGFTEAEREQHQKEQLNNKLNRLNNKLNRLNNKLNGSVN